MIGSIQQVHSLDDPGLILYKTLKHPLKHLQQGVFIAEGNKVVMRLLQSNIEIYSLLMTAQWLGTLQPLLDNRPENLTVYIAEKKLLLAIVGFEYHQGIMALAKVPPGQSLEAVLQSSAAPRLFVALDNLTSAENTGVIVRNCAACNVEALLVGETSVDPYLRRAVRNSMGTLFTMPVVYCTSLKDSLVKLHHNGGFNVVAAHPKPGSVPVSSVDLTRDTCFVLGSEGVGVSQHILDVCTEVAVIPMAPSVDSFNVACASAILLYEAMRQRSCAADPERC